MTDEDSTVLASSPRDNLSTVKKPLVSGEVEDIDEATQQRQIGQAAEKLASYVKCSEDDGTALKTVGCMNAWYELEKELKDCLAHIREGNIRPSISLKQSVHNGKALLAEISLRVKVYDASMACHEARFQAAQAEHDLDKVKAYHALTESMEYLDEVLQQTPGRFKAAQKDLQITRETLNDLIIPWKEDLQDRVSRRPHWVPDEFSDHCSCCQKAFGVFRTKHHCRVCGMVYCDSCSSKNLTLPKLAYFISCRVCENCYATHKQFAISECAILEKELDFIFPNWAE